MCPASGLWGVLVPLWWLAVVYLARNSELGTCRPGGLFPFNLEHTLDSGLVAEGRASVISGSLFRPGTRNQELRCPPSRA